MRTEQLKQAITIAKCGSITDAAQKLFMQHATLSHSIRMLEQELGSELFVRSKTGISLTPYGERFIPLAEAMLAKEQEMHGLTIEKSQVPNVYSIECCPVVGCLLADRVLPRLIAAFPDTQFRLLEINPAHLIPHLSKQLPDICLSIYSTDEYAFLAHQMDRENILHTPLRTSEIMAVCHHTNPLVEKREIVRANLADQCMYLPQFVMSPDKLACSRNTENLSLFKKYHLFNNYFSLMHALLQNPDAVTTFPRILLPLLLTEEYLDKLAVMPLQNERIVLYAAYTKEDNAITRELIRLIDEDDYPLYGRIQGQA